MSNINSGLPDDHPNPLYDSDEDGTVDELSNITRADLIIASVGG